MGGAGRAATPTFVRNYGSFHYLRLSFTHCCIRASGADVFIPLVFRDLRFQMERPIRELIQKQLAIDVMRNS